MREGVRPKPKNPLSDLAVDFVPDMQCSTAPSKSVTWGRGSGGFFQQGRRAPALPAPPPVEPPLHRWGHTVSPLDTCLIQQRADALWQ